MAAKTREVKDPNEAFERLGVKAPEIPGGGEVEVETLNEPKEEEIQEEAMPQKVDTSTGDKVEGQQTLNLGEEAGKEVSTTQDEDGNLTETEVHRRSWQAEADKAKAEKLKLEEQIRQVQEQNRQLLNVVSPLMMKYGMQQPQQQETNNKEPEPDFIEDGYFDPKKFAEYERKKEDFLARKVEERVTSSVKKQQEEELTQKQLVDIAREFPEYVNTLTGEVDVNRLYRDLQSHTSKKTMIDIVREMKGKTTPSTKVMNPLNTAESISAIEKNANKPSSAAASSESEARKTEIPDKLKKTMDKFGGMDFPADFDGLKD